MAEADKDTYDFPTWIAIVMIIFGVVVFLFSFYAFRTPELGVGAGLSSFLLGGGVAGVYIWLLTKKY